MVDFLSWKEEEETSTYILMLRIYIQPKGEVYRKLRGNERKLG